MKTMTIRNIPDSVATGLAECARASGRSMNATAVAALAEAFDKDAGKKRRRDFSEFVGILANDDAEAIKREIEEAFEQIDESEGALYVAEAPK